MTCFLYSLCGFLCVCYSKTNAACLIRRMTVTSLSIPYMQDASLFVNPAVISICLWNSRWLHGRSRGETKYRLLPQVENDNMHAFHILTSSNSVQWCLRKSDNRHCICIHDASHGSKHQRLWIMRSLICVMCWCHCIVLDDERSITKCWSKNWGPGMTKTRVYPSWRISPISVWYYDSCKRFWEFRLLCVRQIHLPL